MTFREIGSMASIAYSTLPHLHLTPSLRGKRIAGPVHLSSTGARIGHCTNCRLGGESTGWSQSIIRKQRRSSRRIRGVVDEEGTSSTEKSSVDTELDNSTSNETSASNSVEKRKAAARAEAQRGRNTAIITGAISVLLGVGYLVVLQLLDTRGIELIPPPPEAFDP